MCGVINKFHDVKVKSKDVMVKCTYLNVNSPNLMVTYADLIMNARSMTQVDPINKQAKRYQINPLTELNCVYLSLNFAM